LNVLALLLLGLMAIVLGTYTMASEHAVPVNATGTVGAVVPPWTQTVTARSWNWDIEAIALHAAALLLGPPAGRHIKYSGPRGLIPIIRDGITRPFGRTSS